MKEGRMSSGHSAGMQSGSDFGRKEKELRDAKMEEMRSFDPTLSGANAETVYRDKKGKKLDVLNDFMRQQAIEEGKVC